MKRQILSQLKTWAKLPDRKPLILQGARQVGKSYSVRELGEDFKQFIHIDFLAQKEAHLIFDNDKSFGPERILKDISFLKNVEINPKETLLFFDEIQECKGAMTSLKYFQEEMPELAIIAAGSYLGIMSNEESFPVGKVEYLDMGPMTYSEFLYACDPTLHARFQQIDILATTPIDSLTHKKLLEIWKRYIAVGGLPEVVSHYLKEFKTNENLAIKEARKIQLQLLTGYKADFSKHSGTVNAAHILSVFESVPIQLAKAFDEEVGKFKFTGVIPKHKGFESIRGPLTWLEKSRLVIRTSIANKAEHPLKAYTEENRFKLYFMDVGLLNAALEVPIQAILSDEVGHYKGFIAENFIAQELFAKNSGSLFSWTESSAEIEFLMINESEIIPIEVKASEKSRRAKSLDSYIERYQPRLAYKLTGQNRGFDPNRKMMTLPIYLAEKIK